MSGFDNKKQEKDEFWNLDKLVPKKRKLNPFLTSNPTVTYELPDVAPTNTSSDDATALARSDSERKLNFADDKGVRAVEELTYTPESNGLIKSVTVKHYIDRYDFYDSFRKSALLYYDYKTDKCDFAQFYSYMPQYSQLTPPQRSYYFYWRSELRRGKYIKTDYSYLYLFVYELLNLPDKISPEDGIRILCRVWREYRASLPRIDLYFSIWVQDYCLVHRIECPMDELSDFIFDVINVSSFKEFYLSALEPSNTHGITAMLAYLSDYDWRRGKFVLGNPDADPQTRERQRDSYKENIEGVMYVLLTSVWRDLLANGAHTKTARISRNAFPNSLCTHMVKRMLDIEYCPIAEAFELRSGITAAVRYAENKQRALMGIKSRLAVKEIPDSYRGIIDRYFESLIEKQRQISARECAPEYEKLYSAPEGKLSFAGADEIERMSWDTTLRLVECEDDGEISDAVVPKTPVAPVTADNNTDSEPVTEQSADCYGLSNREIAFIGHLLGIKADSFDTFDNTDALAERINEAFSDNFGDIILEFDGDGYVLIDDYKEETEEWFKKIKR